MDEILDLVNDYDQIIGQQYRSEIYQQVYNNFRVINAFLVNDKNQLWIPRRTKHKKLFPSCLDASVGGHVAAGETYEQAFKRELQEELNLDAQACDYKMIAWLSPHKHHVSAFMHVYLVYFSLNPFYNTEDFESAEWMNVADLQIKIKNGESVKGDLPKLITVVENFLLTQK